jgi:hypothetical protein
MLGHRRLETALRYAKVVDKLKLDAAGRVQLKVRNIAVSIMR